MSLPLLISHQTAELNAARTKKAELEVHFVKARDETIESLNDLDLSVDQMTSRDSSAVLMKSIAKLERLIEEQV